MASAFPGFSNVLKKGIKRDIIGIAIVALLLAFVPSALGSVFVAQSTSRFWRSADVQNTLGDSNRVVEAVSQRTKDRVTAELRAMSSDVTFTLASVKFTDPQFAYFFTRQLYAREFSEGSLFQLAQGNVRSLVLINPRERPLESYISTKLLLPLKTGDILVQSSLEGFRAFSCIDASSKLFIYVGRLDVDLQRQIALSQKVQQGYLKVSQDIEDAQTRIYVILGVSSAILILVVIMSLAWSITRAFKPIDDLTENVKRLGAGNLHVRALKVDRNDEIGTLSNAFNDMAARLEEQTGELLSANDQIERRRALIEAVLTGVTAGVVSIDRAGEVRLTNASAAELLATADAPLVGRQLDDIAPELGALVTRGDREAVVAVKRASDTRTLAVKVARDAMGAVLTFDDITQQLSDQRTAAWSDVARRIAHEIKNPLTPIQLAAERLKRRYGSEITSDPGTFVKLTDTIVRQVGDLRRMVDEFSSFARMPKPVFRPESIIDVARQALFLHEVAHPAVSFRLEAPDALPDIVCDRRQLGQALTNLVKNAVEAIEAKDGAGTVTITLALASNALLLTVEDDGIGLPADRERLAEPYVTTRAKGSGLGLAIVKKIVEEHYGSMRFSDRPGGGTCIAIMLDTDALAAAIDDNSDEGGIFSRQAVG